MERIESIIEKLKQAQTGLVTRNSEVVFGLAYMSVISEIIRLTGEVSKSNYQTFSTKVAEIETTITRVHDSYTLEKVKECRDLLLDMYQENQ